MNKIDDVKKLIEEKLIGINSMEELNAIKSFWVRRDLLLNFRV